MPKSQQEQGGRVMKRLFLVLLFLPVAAVADVYVAIPYDTSQALYFPNVDTVQCYSALVGSKPAIVKTDRCRQVLLPTIMVNGSLLLMNRPIEQLLRSCASLGCELRPMPND
jgi:hypothetical protein